ncbi:SdpI family protein [Calorimonas adulescens]|uniref:SdpI family protein n=2 Tax=Calorimonas adulescens TaxID=2606906 RepID=A0A5D8QG42_9THEO|nr:SdpI family protein [Calorimonas adulescens]
MIEMKINKTKWILLGFVALSFILTMIVYPILPDKMPVHWNYHGEIDSYAGKFQGAFMIPIMLLIFYPLFIYLPNIDPRRKNYKKFEGAYDTIIIAIFAFLTAMHVIVLSASLGYKIDMTAYMTIGLSLLFIILGNVLTRIRPNFFVGIKNPWTLSDDDVWKKTHRLGGWLFVLVGILGLFLLLINSKFAAMSEIGGIIAASLIVTIYSYILYKSKMSD